MEHTEPAVVQQTGVFVTEESEGVLGHSESKWAKKMPIASKVSENTSSVSGERGEREKECGVTIKGKAAIHPSPIQAQMHSVCTKNRRRVRLLKSLSFG